MVALAGLKDDSSEGVHLFSRGRFIMFQLQGRYRHSRSAALIVDMAVMAFAVGVAVTPVRADVRVGGASNAVQIETQNASVEEILAALGSAYGVNHRSAVGLEKRLSGKYGGSLRAVVTRVLDGHRLFVR